MQHLGQDNFLEALIGFWGDSRIWSRIFVCKVKWANFPVWHQNIPITLTQAYCVAIIKRMPHHRCDRTRYLTRKLFTTIIPNPLNNLFKQDKLSKLNHNKANWAACDAGIPDSNSTNWFVQCILISFIQCYLHKVHVFSCACRPCEMYKLFHEPRITRELIEHNTPRRLKKNYMGRIFSTFALHFWAWSILALFVNVE